MSAFFKGEKKTNIVLTHKKSDKQLMQNYRASSLLPICGEILEKIICVTSSLNVR